MRSWFLGFGLLLAIGLGWWTVTPPRPLGVDAPNGAFSAERAMRDVYAIASEPHPSQSAADKRVIVYLAHRLAAMGLRVGLDRVPLDDHARAKMKRWGGADLPAGAEATSIIALLPGRDPHAPAIVLMAHHDSVWASPGAADDGIGVATVLETVRALKAGPPLARNVVVVLTDGEELALSGAAHIYAQPALKGAIGAVLNFEARGGGGRVAMFETGRDNGAMMDLFARAVPSSFANSLAVTVYRLMPNSTDLTPALRQGFFGFNFAITGDAWAYHSPMATPERLDRRSLQDMGNQALPLTRALAGAGTLPARTPDKVFGDIWGGWLILYPAWGGWVLLAVSLMMAASAAAAVHGGQGDRREVVSGLLLPVGLIVVTGVVLFLVNTVSGAGAGANYYDRLAALPRLEVQAVLICLAVLLLLASWSRLTRWGGWIALFVLTAVLGLGLQIVGPTMATPIHWPLALAAAQMAIAAWIDPQLERPHGFAPIALLAAAGGGQALAFGHFLFLNLGAGMPFVVILPLLVMTLLFWPLIAGMVPMRKAMPIAGLALVAAVAIALWVRFDPVAPSIPPYSDGKRA